MPEHVEGRVDSRAKLYLSVGRNLPVQASVSSSAGRMAGTTERVTGFE